MPGQAESTYGHWPDQTDAETARLNRSNPDPLGTFIQANNGWADAVVPDFGFADDTARRGQGLTFDALMAKRMQERMNEGRTVTVKAGQTLSGIVGTNDLSVLNRIAAYNGLASAHEIYAGNSLSIPGDAVLAGVEVPSSLAQRTAEGVVYFANRQAQNTRAAAHGATSVQAIGVRENIIPAGTSSALQPVDWEMLRREGVPIPRGTFGPEPELTSPSKFDRFLDDARDNGLKILQALPGTGGVRAASLAASKGASLVVSTATGLYGTTVNLINDWRIYGLGAGVVAPNLDKLNNAGVVATELVLGGDAAMPSIVNVPTIGRVGNVGRAGSTTAEVIGEVPSLGWPGKGGAGPVPGTIGITDSTSVNALRNYNPRGGGVEFVYDPTTNTFVAGKPTRGLFDGSPHEQLAQSIGSPRNSSEVVGGTFQRGTNGEFFTTENSGHYGKNWNNDVRTQFQKWLSERVQQPVVHESWRR